MNSLQILPISFIIAQHHDLYMTEKYDHFKEYMMQTNVQLFIPVNISSVCFLTISQ